MQLNDSQERVVQQAIHWFRNSSEQTFEFTGEAGTGKSVVLQEIIRRLGLNEYQYMPMAYTGQAAIVMRLKGFTNARSIHSYLYEVREVLKFVENDVIVNSTFNVPETCLQFSLKTPKSIPEQIKLFVIDEGYMVPQSMRRDIESFGRKVLVAGDSGQLPPVSGQPAYLTGYDVKRLTQIMRQAEGDPIIYLAHRARRGQPIHCGMYGNNVLVIEDRDLSDAMLKATNVVVCGTNVTRDMMNRYIRGNIRNIYSDFPIYGDRVICRNNNWFIERDHISLTNGLVGTVVNMPDLSGYTGDTLNIDFVPDLGNVLFNDLSIDYKYLRAPYQERNRLKSLPYKTGEKFEYAYALTTYLAQGAEYPYGIYIEEFLRSNIQNQLNYTGITRFRNGMIYVKKSKGFNIFIPG